jgi:hypothetical protein
MNNFMADKRILPVFIFLFISCGLLSCSQNKSRDLNLQEWGSYWFQGQAEISTFELNQFRYGEERAGEAVLIFVTEEFSRKQQVKIDDHLKAGKDKITVLKLNQSRDFITGIYPYHVMISAFTPIKEDSPGLKFSASVQEWCGHAYVQINQQRPSYYSGTLHSYFQKEADIDITFSGLLEDDLWNLIRINPALIPTGELHLLPSLIYQRFTHAAYTPIPASVQLQQQGNRTVLSVHYAGIGRKLDIEFETAFPYEILGWKEIGLTATGEQEVTEAKRKGFRKIDYWNRNAVEDEFLRKELNLK